MHPLQRKQFGPRYAEVAANLLGPVVQTLDSAIHWINHYPVDEYLENQLHRLHYPLDRDLSAG